MCTTNISLKSSDNQWFLTDESGVRYSADGMILISVPKDIVSYQAIHGTRIIGKEAFKDSAIEEVVLPDTIITIEDGAFSGCKSLQSINLPQSIRRIESDAFRDCESLKEIWLPRCIDGININTFSGCHSLERVYIPSGVEFIGLGAFTDCKSLRSLLIPVMASIDAYAFSGCTALSEIHLPIISKHIEEEVLEGCASLKSVDYWYDYIPARTFAGCTSLEFLKIRGKLEMLEDDAFYFCDSLRKVEFCVAPHPEFKDFKNFFKFNDANEIEFVIPSSTVEQFAKLFDYAKENPGVKICVKPGQSTSQEVEQDEIAET